MKIIEYYKLTSNEKKELLKRPAVDFETVFESVRPILSDIKLNGLPAALNYAQKFDGLTASEIKVTEKEFLQAEKDLDIKIKNAIDDAASNIRKFHKLQKPLNIEAEISAGIHCHRKYKPIDSVGLYIPGGTAPLPSTMLMLGIPASIAGCARIAACSPAKNNYLNPAILYAAKVAGVTEVYKIGGSQAIALMAYGCDDFQKVDKIFGPGNQYVTAAKMLISIDPEGAAIDMPAGPSEVLIIADDTAKPAFVAADLLSQAEHGTDSQVILVTPSKHIAEATLCEVNLQLVELPRKQIAEKALENSSIILTASIDEAINLSNQYAPEHLILSIDDAEIYTEMITNAGSVFIGNYSPESAGDYASGTNHSLPTSGYSKTFSGIGVESFMKSITYQKLSYEGLAKLSSTIIDLAEAEDLSAHAKAVKIRMKK